VLNLPLKRVNFTRREWPRLTLASLKVRRIRCLAASSEF